MGALPAPGNLHVKFLQAGNILWALLSLRIDDFTCLTHAGVHRNEVSLLASGMLPRELLAYLLIHCFFADARVFQDLLYT